MNKKKITEREFLEGIARLRRRPSVRERLRPQVAFTDRKKEASRKRCRHKPPNGSDGDSL